MVVKLPDNYITVYPYRDAKLADKFNKTQKRSGKLCAGFEKNIHVLLIAFQDSSNAGENEISKHCQHIINMSEIMHIWNKDLENEQFLKSL